MTLATNTNPTYTLASAPQPSGDILAAVAIIGLAAINADGIPARREFEVFMGGFRERFMLSERLSLVVVARALAKLREMGPFEALSEACQTLTTHLTKAQRLGILDHIEIVVLADRRIHEHEEHYLDLVASLLDIHREYAMSPLSDPLGQADRQ